MGLQEPRLSVVVPTRNRSRTLHGLLRSICAQSLPPEQFEVIIVDDGSDPPMTAFPTITEMPFRIRALYRDRDHGAHPSRRAGLRAASGRRVLFLDDDVVADFKTLESHASDDLGERIALGPILYPKCHGSTPYFRYMAQFYETCHERVLSNNGQFHLGDYYVCNSSGPRRDLIAAFDAASDSFPYPMVGGEFDEALLAQVFGAQGNIPIFLPEAMLWHQDTKTLVQACNEGLHAGAAMGHMLLVRCIPYSLAPLAEPILGRSMNAALRRLTMRSFWAFPSPFRVAARLLALVAARGPRAIVPRGACHLPLRLSRWEGLRSAIPSFTDLLILLQQPPVGDTRA